MTTVALALSEGVSLFELATPIAVFDAPPPAGVTGWYELRVCGPPGVQVDRWFTATTPFTYADLEDADTVVVPACHDADLRPSSELVNAVRRAHRRGARIVSICTGAFVLAEAGLLDGRRATTHWAHTRRLAWRYPRVRVDQDVLYVDEGDILTSAGKAAGTDLVLHLVRTDHGVAASNEIARRLVAPPHRDGGQAQYVARRSSGHGAEPLSEVLDWARERLQGPLTVADLAQRANVTVRTLNRRFHDEVGSAPLRWLQRERLWRAQELLEQTDAGVDRIADRAGFGSAAALRRQFRHDLGVTPDAYRRTFAAP